MTNLKVSRNIQGVINNRFQGDALKVLTVCSAGCLRSPTAASLLAAEPWNFNTRSCGLNTDFAIVPISPILLMWAEVIVVMESWMFHEVEEMLAATLAANNLLEDLESKRLICLSILDEFGFMDEELQTLMQTKFTEHFKI